MRLATARHEDYIVRLADELEGALLRRAERLADPAAPDPGQPVLLAISENQPSNQ